jgi:hypothetical protein
MRPNPALAHPRERRMPGAGGMGFQQDRHHWGSAHPANLAERGRYYIQVLAVAPAPCA